MQPQKINTSVRLDNSNLLFSFVLGAILFFFSLYFPWFNFILPFSLKFFPRYYSIGITVCLLINIAGLILVSIRGNGKSDIVELITYISILTSIAILFLFGISIYNYFSLGFLNVLGTGFYLCVGGLFSNLFSLSQIKSQKTIEEGIVYQSYQQLLRNEKSQKTIEEGIVYQSYQQLLRNEKRFCNNCGKGLIQDGEFCIDCDSKNN
ncbi:MAG: hypothetical protein HeimC3_47140 [Candidatus Heimdallarchaeota archaeon LC_3]|nr:MAG: hypothetical protein HeimC3_47140 [Candidatus Heimdallarchaeota archaeon LC_3]